MSNGNISIIINALNPQAPPVILNISSAAASTLTLASDSSREYYQSALKKKKKLKPPSLHWVSDPTFEEQMLFKAHGLRLPSQPGSLPSLVLCEKSTEVCCQAGGGRICIISCCALCLKGSSKDVMLLDF